MDILADYADVLQVVGMDEAYLDVTQRLAGDFGDARNLARSLVAAIARVTGLSASVGIGPSKSVAKIASDFRKPHGITLVAPEDCTAFLAPLPVHLINGCGPKTASKLIEWDIRTIGELAIMDRPLLETRFGRHGAWLHDVANGIDTRIVHSDRGARKSRGNERTYFQDEVGPDAVVEHARRLLAGLVTSDDRRAFSTLTVKIRYADFTTITRSHTSTTPMEPASNEAAQRAGAAVEALLRPELDGRPVRLVGVRLSSFSNASGQRALSHYGIQAGSFMRRPARPRSRGTTLPIPLPLLGMARPAFRAWASS